MFTDEIHGGEVLIFGDLHFSDVFKGKHKDYLSNCCSILHDIELKVDERKPSAIVLAGDLIGWTETNIKNREVLTMFCGFWKRISEKCKVFAVRGNHDIKGFPDFNLLLELGVLKTPKYFDYYADDGTRILRFHIVSYGAENEPLCIDDTVKNVVIGHNNFIIPGCTTWYQSHDGLELSHLENFCGVDMVVSGHIHEPSPELYKTTMSDDSECSLFYVGCPTRPQKETYDACWIVSFYGIKENGGMEAEFETLYWQLAPHEDLYYEDEEFIDEKSEDELEEELRKEKLAEVLGDIVKYRMLGGDPLKQIDAIPNATDKAKEVAKKYLQIAMQN